MQAAVSNSNATPAGERRIFVAAFATAVTVAAGLLVALHLALREYVIHGTDWLL
jgi:hypothetical protein